MLDRCAATLPVWRLLAGSPVLLLLLLIGCWLREGAVLRCDGAPAHPPGRGGALKQDNCHSAALLLSATGITTVEQSARPSVLAVLQSATRGQCLVALVVSRGAKTSPGSAVKVDPTVRPSRLTANRIIPALQPRPPGGVGWYFGCFSSAQPLEKPSGSPEVEANKNHKVQLLRKY